MTMYTIDDAEFMVGDYSEEDHHASLSYNDVKKGGPPARPLEFPTPTVYNATYRSILALDHRTLRVHTVNNVLTRETFCFDADRSTPQRAYLIKRKIAKSSYGSIKLCIVLKRRSNRDLQAFKEVEWESTEELVVIKISCWSRIRKKRGMHLEDPLKEAAALQHLGSYHPNVLGCIEVLQDEENLYTVLPHCGGGELITNIIGSRESREPNEEQARIYFRQLLNALDHMQKKGVCHRDLTVENLMLDNQDNLVVIDLGLALRVPYTDRSNADFISDVSEGTQRRLIQAQGQSGSLSYLAPEIVEEKDAFDGFAVDLWAAGVILFVILVGMTPFRWAHVSDSAYALINRGKLNEVMQAMNIPLSEPACNLLQNMMWRDPRKRLSLAQVMNHPWVVAGDKANANSRGCRYTGPSAFSSATLPPQASPKSARPLGARGHTLPSKLFSLAPKAKGGSCNLGHGDRWLSAYNQTH